MLRKFFAVALLSLSAIAVVWADEVTFTGVNFGHSTLTATAGGLQFANVINVLATDNSTGKSVMLLSIQSGNTGASTDFVAGPPLVADYLGSGAGSVLVASNGHTFLSGMMEDSGRAEAEYPDRAGAFLSRFLVNFVDPAVLTELGTSTHWKPEGSVSLTFAQTRFDGASGTLDAVLGGSQITIETTGITPEVTPLWLLVTGMFLTSLAVKARRW